MSVCIILSSPDKRKIWIDSLNAEGIRASEYYGKAVYECGIFSRPKVFHAGVSAGEIYDLHPVQRGTCPKTEDIARRTVWITLSPKLEESDAELIVRAVRKVLNHFGG